MTSLRPLLNTILIYAKDPAASADFYRRHFGFEGDGTMVEGLIELSCPASGAGLLIHQAAKSVRRGRPASS